MGLPLPERDGCCVGADAAAVAFGMPAVETVRRMDAEAEEAGAAVACAGGASPPNFVRSWGAGEGAIAIAVLIVG